MPPAHREVARVVADELAGRGDVLAVMLVGSAARGNEVATSDVDLLAVVSGAGGRGPGPRALRDGYLVETFAKTQAQWEERLRRPRPMWIYSFLEAEVLYDAGPAARLRSAARSAYDDYVTPEELREELATTLRHGEPKLRRALQAGRRAGRVLGVGVPAGDPRLPLRRPRPAAPGGIPPARPPPHAAAVRRGAAPRGRELHRVGGGAPGRRRGPVRDGHPPARAPKSRKSLGLAVRAPGREPRVPLTSNGGATALPAAGAKAAIGLCTSARRSRTWAKASALSARRGSATRATGRDGRARRGTTSTTSGSTGLRFSRCCRRRGKGRSTSAAERVALAGHCMPRGTVTGIDSSRTLVALAGEAGGYEELACGDAAALPWEGDAFDLAVAYMSLHDVDDLEPVVAELARVLQAGGLLCLAIVHPLNRSPEALDDYFEERRFADEFERDGLRMTFEGVDRPLEAYLRALARAGFLIEELREPRPTAAVLASEPRLAKAAGRPYFLHVRCVLARGR